MEEEKKIIVFTIILILFSVNLVSALNEGVGISENGVEYDEKILDESPKNRIMHERFKEIDKTYQKLIKKAKSNLDDSKILFFQYSGETSISADLSNQLSYLFPEKVIVVMRVLDVTTSISVRGEKVRKKVLKAIEGLEGATGGGHENAVGAKIKTKDLEEFKEMLR